MVTLNIYIGSYGPRYSDPIGTYAGLTRESVEDAIDRAIAYEREELPGYCDLEHPADGEEADCSLCNPDIVSFGAWPVRSGRMTFRELLATMRELRADPSRVVALER